MQNRNNRTRNKKLAAGALTALACGALGVGAAAAHPHKVTHVSSKVKIAYQAPGNEYSPDTGFTGKVKAKQGCDAKRTVKLSHYGKTKTSKSGAFAFGVGASGADPGDYKVKVPSSTLAGGDVVCDAVKATITVSS
jgi:hypothetical protein